MEHPEKALFDEVRGLRNDIEDAKERIFKAEKEYEENVIKLEKRCIIEERCNGKLKEWKEKISSPNSKVTFIINEKEYIYFRSTLTENIFNINPNFVPENENTIFVEAEKNFFKSFIEIIRKGHSAFKTGEKLKTSNSFDKNVKENVNFIEFLKNSFTEKSFLEVVKYFGIPFTYTSDLSKTELLESFSVDKPYISTSLDEYLLFDVKDLANFKNKKAVFLDYDASLTITLADTLRTNKIFIKPFTYQTSKFTPTNGNTYTIIYTSENGVDYTKAASIPSDYGSANNNYLSKITFDNHENFKYVKFKTNSSCYFSLSYLGFKDDQDFRSKKK
jgi:hypothetical protein